LDTTTSGPLYRRRRISIIIECLFRRDPEARRGKERKEAGREEIPRTHHGYHSHSLHTSLHCDGLFYPIRKKRLRVSKPVVNLTQKRSIMHRRSCCMFLSWHPLRLDVSSIVHRRAPRITPAATTCAFHVARPPTLSPSPFFRPLLCPCLFRRRPPRARPEQASEANERERTLRNSETPLSSISRSASRPRRGLPGGNAERRDQRRDGRHGGVRGAAWVSRSDVYFHLTCRRRGHPLPPPRSRYHRPPKKVDWPRK